MLLAALSVCAAAIALGVMPALAASGGGQKPKVEKISQLYVVTAASGSLSGKGKHLTLTLRGVAEEAVWFADRPTRRSGNFPSSDLPNSWKGFGFVSDPPNAALVYEDPALGFERSVVLTLGKPRAQGHSLTFAVHVQAPGKATGNVVTHAAGADTRPAARFGNASLFIDDGEAPVAGNCTLQPNENCSELSLNRANLEYMDLHGLWLIEPLGDYGLNARGTNFEGAHFINAEIENSEFTGANFKDAELVGVNLTNANLFGTEFEGALFRNSSLDGSEGEPSFKGASFCNTTMPNGSVNNSGC